MTILHMLEIARWWRLFTLSVVVDSAHECREENKCIKSELVLSIASDLKRTWIIKTKVDYKGWKVDHITSSIHTYNV